MISSLAERNKKARFCGLFAGRLNSQRLAAHAPTARHTQAVTVRRHRSGKYHSGSEVRAASRWSCTRCAAKPATSSAAPVAAGNSVAGQAISDGTYRINAEAIADKLIANAKELTQARMN